MSAPPTSLLGDDGDEATAVKNAAASSFAATILGANQLATEAKTLGEKVFWRMLRDEMRKEYEKLGGQISYADVPG